MRISAKLTLAAWLPALVAIFIGLGLLFSYRSVKEAQEKDVIAQQIINGVHELNNFARSYMIYHEERPKQQFLLGHESITRLLSSVRFEDPAQQEDLESVRENMASMKRTFLKLVSNYELYSATEKALLIKEAEARLGGQIMIRAREAVSHAVRLEKRIDGEIVNILGKINSLILILIAGTTFPLTWLLIRMMRKVTASLTTLRNGTDIIASGNLNHRIGLTTPDEIGELSRSFDHMTEHLRDITVSRDALRREVEERKQAEEALRASEARFRLLSETANHLLTSENPQGTVNELCRRVMIQLDCHAFFNFLVDEAEGRLRLNAYAGIPEEDVRKIQWLDYGVAVCGCAARDGTRIVAEDIFHTPDPRTEQVKSYGIRAYACHPLMAHGRLIGTLSFGTRTRNHFSEQDLELMKTVTDQVAIAMDRIRLIDGLRRSRDELEKRVEERTAELMRSNRELQDFAFIASHDLKEPLRKVQTFGNLLLDAHGGSLNDKGRDYLIRMLSAATRMQGLITSLLEYSRVTTRAEPFSQTNLNEAVKEALSNLEIRISETGGRVDADGLPTIMADRSQMIQLFQNLIGNALKFHKEDVPPIVKVCGRHLSEEDQGKGEAWEIAVEDNGIGFDETKADRIFEPFQRLHGRASPYSGTGMGLAICRKIVERHGGTIEARSIPGEGSTFIIRMPG